MGNQDAGVPFEETYKHDVTFFFMFVELFIFFFLEHLVINFSSKLSIFLIYPALIKNSFEEVKIRVV